MAKKQVGAAPTAAGDAATKGYVDGRQRVDTTAGRAIYVWDNVNNREQLIYGDTGYRALVTWTTGGVVTGTMPTGFAAQVGIAGGFYLRRQLNTIQFSIHGARATDTGQNVPLPDGFRPGGAPFPTITMLCNVGTTVTLASSSVGNYDLWMTFPNGCTIPNASADYGSMANWTTQQSWPTSLPGTAVGEIPN